MAFAFIIQLVWEISKESLQEGEEGIVIAIFQLKNKFANIKTTLVIDNGCIIRDQKINKTILLASIRYSVNEEADASTPSINVRKSYSLFLSSSTRKVGVPV